MATDLLLGARKVYVLRKGARDHLAGAKEEKTANTFEFEATCYPPLMLLPRTWRRYGYSKSDVYEVFSHLDAAYTWQLALMLLPPEQAPEMSLTGVRATFRSPYSFTFVANRRLVAAMIERVQATKKNAFKAQTTSVLCHERSDHRPFLPKVHVSQCVFDALATQVPARRPSFCWTPVYGESYRFKDIHLVPLALEGPLILMGRVVERTAFERLGVSVHSSVVSMPVYVRVGKVEHVLTEECCFFLTCHKNRGVPTPNALNAPAAQKKTKVRGKRKRQT
jgi:hypothetical protein